MRMWRSCSGTCGVQSLIARMVGTAATSFKQRIERIALPARSGYWKDDDRQVRGVRDAAEMREHHLRPLAQRQRTGRENQERRGAALLRHARERAASRLPSA